VSKPNRHKMVYINLKTAVGHRSHKIHREIITS
jgi:hypothetical protein